MAKRSTRSKKAPTTPRRRPTRKQGGLTLGVVLLALIVGAVRLLGGQGTFPDLTDLTDPPAPTAAIPQSGDSASRGSSPPSDDPAERAANPSPDNRQAERSPGADQPDSTEADVRSVLDGLNSTRADARLGALRLDDRLGAAALALSRDLASSGRCSHDGGDGSDTETRMNRAGYAPTAYGEIVACGSESPDGALGQWRNSSAHRKILLDARFRDAGVGVSLDGRDGPVWVVTFGAER